MGQRICWRRHALHCDPRPGDRRQSARNHLLIDRVCRAEQVPDNISATVEDCKRFDIAWSRAHDRFFCADLVLLILVTPIAIAGASLWQNVADAEDDGSQGISAFRGSVVLCWLIFLMTSVCGVQDYVAAQNDSGLLN
mmetsp:Transcript_34475/g.91531  ORF Transcript_34475/g.91531 Transcript_34475/m.91531 type:complete len:138 (+) Transcript_34475:253-666(+)